MRRPLRMFERIFPRQFDNTYRGYWLAVWILVPLVLAKLAMGISVIIVKCLVGRFRYAAPAAAGGVADDRADRKRANGSCV